MTSRNWNRAGWVAVVVGLGIALSGCSDPVQPSARWEPQPQPPPPLPTGYVISGIVTGSAVDGPEPLEGVTVHDQYTHHSARTAADGSYRLERLGHLVIIDVRVDGYRYYETALSLDSDRRLDIELQPER